RVENRYLLIYASVREFNILGASGTLVESPTRKDFLELGGRVRKPHRDANKKGNSKRTLYVTERKGERFCERIENYRVKLDRGNGVDVQHTEEIVVEARLNGPLKSNWETSDVGFSRGIVVH
ncbi:hypothetical protein V1477_014667, partial [Vespula maculifrons]